MKNLKHISLVFSLLLFVAHTAFSAGIDVAFLSAPKKVIFDGSAPVPIAVPIYVGPNQTLTIAPALPVGIQLSPLNSTTYQLIKTGPSAEQTVSYAITVSSLTGAFTSTIQIGTLFSNHASQSPQINDFSDYWDRTLTLNLSTPMTPVFLNAGDPFQPISVSPALVSGLTFSKIPATNVYVLSGTPTVANRVDTSTGYKNIIKTPYVFTCNVPLNNKSTSITANIDVVDPTKTNLPITWSGNTFVNNFPRGKAFGLDNVNVIYNWAELPPYSLIYPALNFWFQGLAGNLGGYFGLQTHGDQSETVLFTIWGMDPRWVIAPSSTNGRGYLNTTRLPPALANNPRNYFPDAIPTFIYPDRPKDTNQLYRQCEDNMVGTAEGDFSKCTLINFPLEASNNYRFTLKNITPLPRDPNIFYHTWDLSISFSPSRESRPFWWKYQTMGSNGLVKISIGQVSLPDLCTIPSPDGKSSTAAACQSRGGSVLMGSGNLQGNFGMFAEYFGYNTSRGFPNTCANSPESQIFIQGPYSVYNNTAYYSDDNNGTSSPDCTRNATYVESCSTLISNRSGSIPHIGVQQLLQTGGNEFNGQSFMRRLFLPFRSPIPIPATCIAPVTPLD